MFFCVVLWLIYSSFCFNFRKRRIRYLFDISIAITLRELKSLNDNIVDVIVKLGTAEVERVTTNYTLDGTHHLLHVIDSDPQDILERP
ncbi:hypothetical protein C0J52_14054 [Blattella germanica]|nr:hypothetical protein C0J52_14054 [Blattella germanica]